LPFAPLVAERELQEALAGVGADCELLAKNPYFIVCNQFWVHKDHATAFRAFAAFASSSSRRDWRLVCTGLTDDYRAPRHFTELKELVADLGIADRVVFTGFIDRARQQSLLLGAAALLQPTLFEGGPGGGAASDAVALGVPCVLSDIDVNRELLDPLATFFSVGDPVSLTARMEAIAQQPPERPNVFELLARSEHCARKLGGTLYAIAEQALTR
jgi:glycosyltransferase involved in cell wall biosynthesis